MAINSKDFSELNKKIINISSSIRDELENEKISENRKEEILSILCAIAWIRERQTNSDKIKDILDTLEENKKENRENEEDKIQRMRIMHILQD